jgi:peptidyl-prolyl cis-trans isomerase A (cyclophilin A)
MAEQQAILKTNRGDITVNLFPNHAPKTVANFTGLATGEKAYSTPNNRSGPFYDGLTFHRVIENFMIQGGCPLGSGTGGPGYQFEDEIHPELVFDKPYLLAMANAGPGTNGSQFFITTAETPWLNRKHTIFGEVADQASRDVVDQINTTPTGAGDRPVEPVIIDSLEIVGGGPAPSRQRAAGCRTVTGTPIERHTSAASGATGSSARTACARPRSGSSARSV